MAKSILKSAWSTRPWPRGLYMETYLLRQGRTDWRTFCTTSAISSLKGMKPPTGHRDPLFSSLCYILQCTGVSCGAIPGLPEPLLRCEQCSASLRVWCPTSRGRASRFWNSVSLPHPSVEALGLLACTVDWPLLSLRPPSSGPGGSETGQGRFTNYPCRQYTPYRKSRLPAIRSITAFCDDGISL